MIEIVLGILPGSVFVYRYAPRFELAKLIGFLLMEIVPFVVIATFGKVGLSAVLIGFLVTYSIYEIGYVQNDFVAKKETQGKIERTQFARFRIGLFLTVRLPVIILCSYWAVRVVPGATHGMCAVAVMLAIFILHNYLVNPTYRVTTFIALNSLKIIARIIFLSPALLLYTFASVPHLIIKLIHYLGSKQVITIKESTIWSISVPIYLGFMIGMTLIDWRLCLVCLPYFLNHCKRDIINGLQLVFAPKVGGLTKDIHR
jgi:hypothetical protein